MNYRVIAVLLVLCSLESLGQCSINVSLKKICLGATTVFTPSPATANDSAFAWSFGDGSTSAQVSPTYQYPKAGTYTVTLRIYTFGGNYCEATPITVNVFDKPTAKYNRISAYAQCFDNNRFEFLDVSQPGTSNAPLKQRTIVYDDGAFDLDLVLDEPAFDHSYSDIAGGKYKVVLEVKDTNDCIDQYVDSVVVHPKTINLSLNIAHNVQCTKTDIILSHNGPYNATNANKITWILGNGDTLYAPWNNLSYTYISQAYRMYQTRVIIEDKNGCIIKSDSQRVFTASPDSVIQLYHFNNSCFSNNIVAFGHYNLFQTRKWIVSLNGDTTIYDHNSLQPDSVQYHRFKTCGKANVRLEYTY
ncbi:MAG: PKD domain-containing protein, partial [Bacteroidetes bacterium]